MPHYFIIATGRFAAAFTLLPLRFHCRQPAIFTLIAADCRHFIDYGAIATSAMLLPLLPLPFRRLPTFSPLTRCCRFTPGFAGRHFGFRRCRLRCRHAIAAAHYAIAIRLPHCHIAAASARFSLSKTFSLPLILFSLLPILRLFVTCCFRRPCQPSPPFRRLHFAISRHFRRRHYRHAISPSFHGIAIFSFSWPPLPLSHCRLPLAMITPLLTCHAAITMPLLAAAAITPRRFIIFRHIIFFAFFSFIAAAASRFATSRHTHCRAGL